MRREGGIRAPAPQNDMPPQTPCHPPFREGRALTGKVNSWLPRKLKVKALESRRGKSTQDKTGDRLGAAPCIPHPMSLSVLQRAVTQHMT